VHITLDLIGVFTFGISGALLAIQRDFDIVGIAILAVITALGGGILVVAEGEVKAELPLPVAGLLADLPLDEVVSASRACVEATRQLGCTLPSPFQSMAFLALSVIPSLKLTDRGLVDVDAFELVPFEV